MYSNYCLCNKPLKKIKWKAAVNVSDFVSVAIYLELSTNITGSEMSLFRLGSRVRSSCTWSLTKRGQVSEGGGMDNIYIIHGGGGSGESPFSQIT